MDWVEDALCCGVSSVVFPTPVQLGHQLGLKRRFSLQWLGSRVEAV